MEPDGHGEVPDPTPGTGCGPCDPSTEISPSSARRAREAAAPRDLLRRALRRAEGGL